VKTIFKGSRQEILFIANVLNDADFKNMRDKNFVAPLFTVKILPLPLQCPICAMFRRGKDKTDAQMLKKANSQNLDDSSISEFKCFNCLKKNSGFHLFYAQKRVQNPEKPAYNYMFSCLE
jgi:hypothetical protein